MGFSNYTHTMCDHEECQNLLETELMEKGRVFTDASEFLFEETKFPPPIAAPAVLREDSSDYYTDEESEGSPRYNEGYADQALFEKNRVEQVQTNLKLLEEWVMEGRMQEVTLLATWLYEQHVEYGDIHDAELLVLLKDVAEEYRAGSSYTIDPIEEPTYYRFE